MYLNLKKTFLVLFLLSIGAGIGISVNKFIDRYNGPKQTVSVIGTGEIDAAMDQGTIEIQLKTTGDTLEKAQTENKKEVDDMKKSLKSLGIPESRIKVSSYSSPGYLPTPTFSYIYTNSESRKPMPIFRPPNTSPTVTTNIEVILDPIKNIEKVYDTISQNQNAQIINSYYSLKNGKAFESKAKEEALKDARVQVEQIAKINKLRVGKLLSITDSSDPGIVEPQPNPMMLDSSGTIQESFKAIDNNIRLSDPISERTEKITFSYNVKYELY